MERRLSTVRILVCILACLQGSIAPLWAQSNLHRIDSILALKYHRVDIDTAYLKRPHTKWTLTARLNVSGAKIEAGGIENGQPFKAEMEANRKMTLSVGVSYLGLSVSASVNPVKLMGKYHDFELNLNSYGRRLGFDIIYQNAKNFTGWHDHERLRVGDGTSGMRLRVGDGTSGMRLRVGDGTSGMRLQEGDGTSGMGRERITLPDGLLSVKTLNVNAFYVFNSRRFSYPAAFSQSYIQRRSAGGFLLAASGMAQHAALDWEQAMRLKMTNIGLGAGYGYNYVPGQGWLLHLSALPTFIVYSSTSMTFGDEHIPLHYHFPEVIITGRGAVVRQWGNKFLAISMVFNFINIGYEESLALHNIKWNIRTSFGLRL